MIRRHAFERLAAAYPASRYRMPSANPWRHDFFATSVEGGELLSEDFAFCARWRAIGGEVWVDPAVKLRHHGRHAYEGDPMTLFASGLAAPASAA